MHSEESQRIQERGSEMTKNTEEHKLTDILAQKRTDMAAERTAMSADRSLMAWIRTALSMIGFGFTIYKFLEVLKSENAHITIKAGSPRLLGLYLIGLGTFSMVLAILQYISTLRMITKHVEFRTLRFPVFVAILICLLGIFLFVALAVKLKGV